MARQTSVEADCRIGRYLDTVKAQERFMNSRILIAAMLFAAAAQTRAADRQILLIAGTPSHGPLQHEHNATVWALQKWLNQVPGVRANAQFDGWPENNELLNKADAIFIFCTGGESHMAFTDSAMASLRKAAARGSGLMFFHYGVEPPAKKGHQEMLDWIGGYFELNYSVNPFFQAFFRTIPKHPITRGVKPFSIRDEWYYNMRFRENMKGVSPILTVVPPASSLSRPDGPHEGNPAVRAKAGQPMTVVWAAERPGGGRGAGFTGGHFHMNLLDENFRKVLLNSLLWIAKMEVPRNGVEVKVTCEELLEHIDPKTGPGGAAPPDPCKQPK
jgi:trehalose utilization protein